MRNRLFLFAIAFLTLVGCRNEIVTASAGYTMEVQNTDESYTVVYVNKGNISDDAARKEALKRAAQLTVDSGYRYFMVDSEGEVAISQPDKDGTDDNNSVPGNMYEDLIVEKNFSRRALESRSPMPAQIYPGYRVVFHFSVENPLGKGMDACDYVPCS